MIFFNEKKIEKDSDNFWCGKLTLKVRNWQFSITWFRAGVDLPESFSYEKVLFFTQLSYHLMCKLLKKLSCYLRHRYPVLYTSFLKDEKKTSARSISRDTKMKWDCHYLRPLNCDRYLGQIPNWSEIQRLAKGKNIWPKENVFNIWSLRV